MRTWSRLLIVSLLTAVAACGSSQPATPKKTFETYIKALKQKDTTTMKLLLSKGTMKMHEQEAKAQGVPVDDIVKRETLFSEGQRSVEYRDEKVEGEKATLQVKNSYGSWETVPFVLESGEWKIDKQGAFDQMIRDMDETNRQMDQMINPGASPTPLY